MTKNSSPRCAMRCVEVRLPVRQSDGSSCGEPALTDKHLACREHRQARKPVDRDSLEGHPPLSSDLLRPKSYFAQSRGKRPSPPMKSRIPKQNSLMLVALLSLLPLPTVAQQ